MKLGKIFQRNILIAVGVVLVGIVLAVVWPDNGLVKNKKNQVILLRSGWQVENIGDVAHTPGFLALAEKYIPEAELIFWPYYGLLPESEVVMLKKRFPKLAIVQGIFPKRVRRLRLNCRKPFPSRYFGA